MRKRAARGERSDEGGLIVSRQTETNTAVRVRPLAGAERIDGLAWLRHTPGTLLYASPEFHRFLERVAEGRVVTMLAERGSRPVGALTWMERPLRDGSCIVNSLPWYGSHGGCALAPEAPVETRRALLAAYRDRIEMPDVLSATMILSPEEEAFRRVYEDALPVRVIDDRIGQVTPLPAAATATDLELMISQKTRNLVRKSLRQGFHEVVSDDPWAWRFLHSVHVENMTAVGGRAKPWEHFAALAETLPSDWRRLSVAMLGDQPVAAMLLVFFNGTVEYLTPVIRHEARPLQPLSFLIWRAMVEAAAMGCHSWNWGGTWRSQESLHHFKAGWGAVDRPYSYLVSASDQGLERLRGERERIVAEAAYYYVYPFALLPG